MIHHLQPPYYLIPTIANNVSPTIKHHNQHHSNYNDWKCIITDCNWLYMKYLIAGVFHQLFLQLKLPRKKPIVFQFFKAAVVLYPPPV